MATLAHAQREIESTLRDPLTTHWLRNALQSAMRRDPVDAANDAEELARLLNDRCDALLAACQARKGGVA